MKVKNIVVLGHRGFAGKALFDYGKIHTACPISGFSSLELDLREPIP